MRQHDTFHAGAPSQPSMQSITLGTVVDTNDPQQMGRVRAICPQWGDNWDSRIDDLPWAIYMTPFGGQVKVGTRGPGIQTTEGGVSYGMWAVPKVGSQVAIVCIDGNSASRMYIGCVYDQFTTHTLPHGRFTYDNHPKLEKTTSGEGAKGPYSSSEKAIQPLATNQRRAFKDIGSTNFEFQSRGADYSVSRIDVTQLSQTNSGVQDDKNITSGTWTSTQGYQMNRQDPSGSSSTYTDGNYDSMVYSFTSPGFHAISMDDRQENCRIRIRTTSGNQIILDDTNERIYVSTAQGNNWIELDQDGNIDVYSATRVSVHAADDINLTSDKSIRMFAKESIHLNSGNNVHLQATNDVHVLAGNSLRLKSGSAANIESNSINFSGGNSIIGTAGIIHLNGPTASASGATPAEWTTRVPTHEPFARTVTANNFTHSPEFGYDDPNVNRLERGRAIERGPFWRR